jgi:hypothetical protein
MEYYVTFNHDCIYIDNTVDMFDVNKLFGFSIGLHHDDSHRFGWNVVDGSIQIYAYSYVDKKRVIKEMCGIEPSKEYKFNIVRKNSKVMFNVFDTDGLIISQVTIPINTKKILGYKLWPYFGGNKLAPHTMHITLKTSN